MMQKTSHETSLEFNYFGDILNFIYYLLRLLVSVAAELHLAKLLGWEERIKTI